MADRFKQSIVIDNRSGAGGTVGTAVAARAPADGYTLLLGDTSLTYAPDIYPDAGFDFGRDFAPISAVARVPYVLVVNPAKLDVATLAAFIAAAKKAPGGIDVGSAGLGTVTHLAIGLFEERTGMKLNHVPYRGGAPMLQDLLAGQVAAAFVVAGAVAPLRQDGQAARARCRQPPPRAAAARRADHGRGGPADFRATIWFGLFAPKKTPDAILDRLHAATQAALEEEKIKAMWIEQGARVEPESRADFARFVAAESERWSRIAKAANIKME